MRAGNNQANNLHSIPATLIRKHRRWLVLSVNRSQAAQWFASELRRRRPTSHVRTVRAQCARPPFITPLLYVASFYLRDFCPASVIAVKLLPLKSEVSLSVATRLKGWRLEEL